MKVLMNTGGIAATNAFLIADEAAKQAVIFDAPNDTAGGLVHKARNAGWDIIGLWLTHGHFDHMADHRVVTDAFPDAKVLIHPADELKIQRPDLQQRLFMLPFTIEPRSADSHVTDAQKLRIGSLEVEVLHTPGHSSGHVCYYIASEKVLVGGDLIIGGSIGRTDLPDSDHAQMLASVRRIMSLPGDTRLLPGHGDISTLDQERQTNPYVQEILGQ